MGDSPAVFGVVLDITDRREAEEILHQRDEEFRQLSNSMPHLVWLAKAEGGVYWCNRRWFEYSGLTPGDVNEAGWESVLHPNPFPAVRNRWKDAVATGIPFEMIFHLRRADGVYRPFLFRAVPL